MSHRKVFLLIGLGLTLLATVLLQAAELTVDTFDRQALTKTYFSEGANFGDLNSDGHQDIVYGPYWFAGPDFSVRREIYKPVPQPVEGYADNFFCWTGDFNGDDLADVLVVGFPGTPAYVYENPGTERHGAHWPKHQVFDWVSNESPQWTNLVGDDRPELVCTRDGYFGYAVPDWEKPFEPWTFHRISEQVAPSRFGHALGVGDVDGDGRQDVLAQNGWYQQPAKLGRPWQFHAVSFSQAGGADMFAYDVDGDGDNDVITSLSAHAFGLAWFEQIQQGDERTFVRHLIMGEKAADNPFGVVFSELHSVALADVDGDGLKDICTGKTYYSHHKQAPMWDAGPVVYWFKLQRTDDGVNWLPFKADDEAGIGRQLIVGDINGDSLPDMLSGGMRGCHLLTHVKTTVDRQKWLEAQPQLTKQMQAGLEPAAAARQMTAPPGFNVQLAAGEPMVHQPVAFTTDARGRIWVAEAYTYPNRAPEGEGKDKIIILEDTDQDGTLDSRKEFMTGLNLISGLEVGFGGVWVGAAPYLMFIPDVDGDDVPDSEPEILLDGFGYQDTHETLNAFIWGPDGWLYGCHGVFTHSMVGKPGTPDADRVPVNAAVWRYHPTRHEFDVFARGTSNPWGVDFNDHGQPFITACVIPHLWHIVQGARYQRQGGRHFNPHIYDDIKTIADHSHYTGNIRDSAWWGHEPELSDSVSLAGGGHAHCGAMIYLADNWPASYRDSIYFNNIHGNRINNDILERHGSGYVGHHGNDFLMANDKWYRGINLKYGPDGTVHVIDWYDKNACHRTNPEIWDRSNGRIYRVSYGDVKPVTVDLSALSSLQLAQLQSHDNDWYVRTARRLLQERAAAGQPMEDVQSELLRQITNSQTTPKKLRAVWALHVIDRLSIDLQHSLLQHDDEHLRAWGIHFAVPEVLPGHSPKPMSFTVNRLLREMASSDSSSLVRLYLAAALQRIPHIQRWPIADALLQHEEDTDDHNIPLMIWYGVEPLVMADAPRAMELAERSRIPRVARYIARRTAAEPTLIDDLVAGLLKTSVEKQAMIVEEMLNAFEGRVDIAMPRSWQASYTHLLRSDDASLRAQADRIAIIFGDKRLLPRMREILASSSESVASRKQALQVLLRGRDELAAPALIAALDQPDLRGDAIRGLASYSDPNTPRELIQRYDQFNEADRRDAISTLTARPEYALALLDAIEGEAIPRKDVHAYHVRQLRSFQDAGIVDRIQEVWGSIRESSADKKAKIAQYKSRLTEDILANADLSHGRVVFNKTCAACHKLFGQGYDIGPDITGSNRANLDYILENAIDPSSVVSKEYRMSTLVLADGRVVTGLVQNETDSAYTVRTVNDVLLVAKADVDDISQSELSLMPEGQLDQLAADDVRDLIAYLASPSQVPLPRVELKLDPETGKVAGAIEGESLKVTSKTDGDARSQDMAGFTGGRWSGNAQLWWTGQKEGSQLDLQIDTHQSGSHVIELALTKARDYGTVQFLLDGELLDSPIDCFLENGVESTGVLQLGPVELSAGEHILSAKITGKHPKAIGYMFGLDYVRPSRLVSTESRPLRIGMIGLDTSHVIAFTKVFNDSDAVGNLANMQIVAGYPGGTEMPASRDRVEGFTTQLREMGIEIVKTIPELLEKVDVVLLESVDGRIHLQEARQVIAAKKRMFIDKPLAGSLTDAIAIFRLAEQHNVPVWSASSIRFASTFQSLKTNEQVGDIIGCTTWGPCKYQPGTPDMFFYGIHGIEGLFAIMGPGCQSVSRVSTDGADVVAGIWKDGRVGTYRGIREGKADFGATAFGSKGIVTVHRASAYQELCGQIAEFFQTGEVPVRSEETLEIFAFMEAADESKRRGGGPVKLAEVLEQATRAAVEKLSAVSEPLETE